jgi:hypothetical protein
LYKQSVERQTHSRWNCTLKKLLYVFIGDEMTYRYVS